MFRWVGNPHESLTLVGIERLIESFPVLLVHQRLEQIDSVFHSCNLLVHRVRVPGEYSSLVGKFRELSGILGRTEQADDYKHTLDALEVGVGYMATRIRP